MVGLDASSAGPPCCRGSWYVELVELCCVCGALFGRLCCVLVVVSMTVGRGRSVAVDLTVSADELAAERWFVGRRWPGGVRCVRCGSAASSMRGGRPMPYRCGDRSCDYMFGVKTGTFMHRSRLSLLRWRFFFGCVRGRLWEISPSEVSSVVGVSVPVAALALLKVQRAWRESGAWLPLSRADLGSL